MHAIIYSTIKEKGEGKTWHSKDFGGRVCPIYSTGMRRYQFNLRVALVAAATAAAYAQWNGIYTIQCVNIIALYKSFRVHLLPPHPQV